jgi:ATP/maltotriose-dependent transcriptional regulator MalT/DNA-binding SARP family transcriptional activator
MAGQDGRPVDGRTVPPAPAPHLIERPRVMAALASASQRRVTALTAGPGFGKTTALAQWAASRPSAWYTATALDRDPITLGRGLLASLAPAAPGLQDCLAPALDGPRGPDIAPSLDAFVPALAGELHARLVGDVVLVLDDLQELTGSPAVRIVADLCDMAPQRLHIVVGSRADLPFPVTRLRVRGQLRVLVAEALGFDEPETADLLARVGGEELRAHAAAVRGLTGGWPAAVRLIAETLAAAGDRERVLTGLRSRGGLVGLVEALLDDEVSAAPPELVALLRVGAALERFNPDLMDALGVPAAASTLATEERRGVHIAPSGSDGWSTLTPTSREYALARLATDPDEVAGVRAEAAAWFVEHGDPAAALRHLCLTGDGAAIAEALTVHGSDLLAAGHGALVAEALDAVPADRRTPAIDLVEGEACQIRGDWDRAVACLSRLVPDYGPAPAAAAWRLGLIHHLGGEPDRALVLYQRGYADPRGSAVDRALAAAWAAAAAWLTGDGATCRDLAAKATSLAEGSGDARALAAAHTAIALLAALDGDRRSNDRHYQRALDYAQRCGDVLQIIRIRSNRGSQFIEEGYYAKAVAELDTAITLADLAGFASPWAMALQNRADALRRLGRLEDARRDLQAALAVQQRLGSRMASYALSGLGAIHADQGNVSLARASYEEALGLADPTGDVQGLVPALCGLAKVIAVDDPDAADRLVGRALASGANLAHTDALLAAGWLALRRGDHDDAMARAEAAAGAARQRRDRAGVAEALELRAAGTDDPAQRRRLLREAEAVWEALACPIPLARTRLALLRAGAGDLTAEEIERTCRDVGARALAAEAAAAAGPARAEARELSVRTLGGFQVWRGGTAVPLRAWQSRKARELLKILIARRGTPVPRAVLCDLLWPEVDPARSGNRLSVAVSTLRSVLDPDRGRAPDRYIVSGEGAIWLRGDHVDIDVESFLSRSQAALNTLDIDELQAAEAAYSGDFCEEDRYADWAGPLREEARAAYVAVARALTQRYVTQGEHETAVRYLLRLLASEPYDERAHLALVRELDAAGRHGDARRMYRAYAARMAELDLEQAPYPDQRETSVAVASRPDFG